MRTGKRRDIRDKTPRRFKKTPGRFFKTMRSFRKRINSFGGRSLGSFWERSENPCHTCQ